MTEQEEFFRVTPAYNLNRRRVSPAAILRPNDLFTHTQRVSGMAAVLRDERLQLTASPSGQLRARPVRVA